MFDLVNGLLTGVGEAFEAYPHQQRAGDVVALNTRFAAQAILKTRQLLGFAVKLLNLPAQGTHLLSALCRALSKVVSHDPFRAVDRHLNPEQLHLEITRKPSDLDQFAMHQLSFAPTERLNTPIRLLPTTIVYQAVALERAVESLAAVHSSDLKHDLFGGIPGVHQHRLKRQLTMPNHQKHLPHMLQLALAIGIRIEDAVVYHPELLSTGVDVHTCDQPNASDHTLFVAAPLTAHHLDKGSKAVVKHRVIKDHAPFGGNFNSRLNLLQ